MSGEDTPLRAIMKYQRTHEGGFPYSFWSALVQGDRLALLGIADWLEEHDDALSASAWRWVHEGGFSPIHEKGYCYWLRSNANPHDYF